ncbi:hypothetical protein [Burkholderia cepacia]|uniref:hypothetical protein n=1 Tax=Burkholderia cepacia TaxID=292 RepID=UPI001651B012
MCPPARLRFVCTGERDVDAQPVRDGQHDRGRERRDRPCRCETGHRIVARLREQIADRRDDQHGALARRLTFIPTMSRSVIRVPTMLTSTTVAWQIHGTSQCVRNCIHGAIAMRVTIRPSPTLTARKSAPFSPTVVDMILLIRSDSAKSGTLFSQCGVRSAGRGRMRCLLGNRVVGIAVRLARLWPAPAGPSAGEKPSFRRFDEMCRRNVEIIGRFASFFVLELILRVPKLCSWLNAVHYIKPIIRR